MSLEKAGFEKYHEGEFDALKEADAQVYELIKKEYERLQNSIELVAAENQCSQAVLAALGSVVQNKTAEGFPGARFHGGCEVVDDVERWQEPKRHLAHNMQTSSRIPAHKPIKLSLQPYWKEEIKY
jgi:glycine/serine hydroxymethyltransferase